MAPRANGDNVAYIAKPTYATKEDVILCFDFLFCCRRYKSGALSGNVSLRRSVRLVDRLID